MLEVISFDVDGTLVDSSFADSVWLEGVPTLYAEQYHVDFETAKKMIMKEYDKIGEDDIRWYKLEYWFNSFKLKGSPHDLLRQYKHKIKVYEEVPEILHHLSEKYKLIVASNAHRDFLSLTLSSIDKYFDHVFSATSDFDQVRKYQNFYQKILNKLQVAPAEVAHVGDHYKFDYEVPLSLGICAFFLDRTGEKGLPNLREFEKKITEK